jgi:predicted nucleic acid-binding protein
VLVVDTSAIVEALVGTTPNPALVDRLAGDGDLSAPHLLDVEFLHALRRLVALGQLSADRAGDARADFADLLITRYPHYPLADRAWALRENVTAYDAVFVALSEALGAPLVTCDVRLASVPGNGAIVELYSGA